MRTEASAFALRTGIAGKLIVVGGSNFGIRYDDEKILAKPDFSFSAFANAAYDRDSEAEVIKNWLTFNCDIDPALILPETMSATTEENAEFLKIILRRRPAFTGNEKIAILTLLYHMERALPVFLKVGLQVEPLFAENLLAMADSGNIRRVCEYYSTPKGGKQYPVDKIQELLTAGVSLAGLMG